MIIYFADRQLNILGQASTKLPKGLTVIDDRKTEDVETGVAVFEGTIPFTKENRAKVEEYTLPGNYILRKHNGDCEVYTIIDAEPDTKNKEVYLYAEDDGMDLLNDVVGPYEADKAYAIDHYINKYAASAGFVIGINEAAGLTRKLSWDGESTATERIASVATQFDGCEISFSFDIDGLVIRKKYINIYKERGKDNGIQTRLNFDIDRIITKKTISNLATALWCTGGTPESEDGEDTEAITLKGYKYDDGDFYVDSEGFLKSRKALKKWSRILWKNDDSTQEGGHITKQYSYDTLSQKELCAHAVTELKKLCDMEVNYEVDFKQLPANAKIGDRINVIDDAGELYLSTRILKLETSVANQEQVATLGEHLIKSHGIHQKVAELAEQFAKTVYTATRAASIAANAKKNAEDAKTAAENAATSAGNAENRANEAQQAAANAAQSAQTAQEAAGNAQAAVGTVQQDVQKIQNSVENAQAAAAQAQQAASTAEEKLAEAQQAAVNAQNEATTAKNTAKEAKNAAESALENVTGAKNAAESAQTSAKEAIATATAARLDAEQANMEIAALGDSLTTIYDTMNAEYARKTDLTETEAYLQSQIAKNAAEIRQTVSLIQTIDETANNAAQRAQDAQEAAGIAQDEAAEAQTLAEAAQQAADNAKTAAENAQAEADTAREAANTARDVATQADEALEAAKADFERISADAEATEEDIAAAQEAVNTAQAAADQAQEAAQAAVNLATAAQAEADEAVKESTAAQIQADKAASDAEIARKAADKATIDAEDAQNYSEEVRATADLAKANAQAAADTAEAAQSIADNAAITAQQAQATADTAQAEAQLATQEAAAAAETSAQAAAELEAAQNRLEEVMAQVDATAEEIAAAEQAVADAETAATAAEAQAQAAQAAADTANEEALEAQTAADNAKAEAEAAQQAADEATAAADEAQSVVDGLAVRMTKAETGIRQNARKISLMASKEEVAEMLGGYTTKEESKAAIELSADEIKATVERTASTLEETIASQNTSLISTCEEMILSAITSFVETGDFSELKQTVESQLTLLADQMELKFTETNTRVENVNGELHETNTTLSKFFDFSLEDGLIIKVGENQMQLQIDNDVISFKKNGRQFGWWDGIDFHTGNIVVEVNERAQFGNFAFVPRSDGSLMFLKIAGSTDSNIVGSAVVGSAVVG